MPDSKDTHHSVYPDLTEGTQHLFSVQQIIIGMIGYAVLLAVVHLIALRTEGNDGVALWAPVMGINLAIVLGLGREYALPAAIAAMLTIFLRPGVTVLPLAGVLLVLVMWGGYELAVILLHRITQTELQLWQLHHLLCFVWKTVVLAAAIDGISVIIISLTGMVSWSDFFMVWIKLLIRDVLSIVAFTPFLLLVLNGKKFNLGDAVNWQTGQTRLQKLLEILAQSLAVLGVLWLAFRSPDRTNYFLYLEILPLLWIAIRYGLPGATGSVLVINLGALMASSGAVWQQTDYLELRIVILVLSLLGLFVGGVISERRITTLEREQLLQAERAQRLKAETLAEVTLALTMQTSPVAVLNEILRQVQRWVPYQTAHIVLLEGDNLRIAYWQGYQDFGSEQLMSHLVQPLSEFALDAEVIRSRTPLVIADTHQEPRWVIQDETAWVRSHLVLPIALSDRVSGLLRLDADKPNAFSAEDGVRLSPLVNAAAIALENARLYEQARQELSERKKAEVALQDGMTQLKISYDQSIIYAQELTDEVIERKKAEKQIRQRNRELALLNRVIAASGRGLEVEAILELTCRELALTFDVPIVVAALFDEQKTTVTIQAECLAENIVPGLNTTFYTIHDPAVQYLLDHKMPLVIPDMQNDPRLTMPDRRFAQRRVISLMMLPLITHGEAQGYLSLETQKTRNFSTAEIDLAWRVADQVSGALARARLDKERRQLSAAIEQSTEGVIITDLKGMVVYTNPAFEQMTGYTKAEMSDINLFTFLKRNDYEIAMHSKLESEVKAGKVWHGRLMSRKKDGIAYTEDITIVPIRNERDTLVNYVAIQRDVTRQLLLEKQYQQSQKMDALGRLTSGIAHDFNNLLTAINGFAEAMQMQMSPDSPWFDVAGKILYTGRRGANLIEQLMAFSRKEAVNPVVLDLNTIVTNTGDMLQPIIGKNIMLETRLTPNVWAIKADPTQIEQILVNLAVNARDAMPNGGQLIIKTANVVLDGTRPDDPPGIKPGAYTLLAVADTGMGMSDEVKAHIFEPFFTTKTPGKGSGLGLATVFGIVEQSKGYIWVDSITGKGTTFKIYLPRVKDVVNSHPKRIDTSDLPQGTETVLIVDDEVAVRELAVRLLSRQGYRVLQAGDGTEAINLAKQETIPVIHLLLTDMLMPQMSGYDLARMLKQTYPAIKVLMMSGQKEEIAASGNGIEVEVTFIRKPFSAVELVRQVRLVIDGVKTS